MNLLLRTIIYITVFVLRFAFNLPSKMAPWQNEKQSHCVRTEKQMAALVCAESGWTETLCHAYRSSPSVTCDSPVCVAMSRSLPFCCQSSHRHTLCWNGRTWNCMQNKKWGSSCLHIFYLLFLTLSSLFFFSVLQRSLLSVAGQIAHCHELTIQLEAFVGQSHLKKGLQRNILQLWRAEKIKHHHPTHPPVAFHFQSSRWILQGNGGSPSKAPLQYWTNHEGYWCIAMNWIL